MADSLIPDYQSVTNTNKRRVWKRLAWVVVILAACGVGLWVWDSFTSRPAKGIYWTKEVDITTGRIRTQYFWWCFRYFMVRETIEDSEITKVLAPADFAGKTPDWREAYRHGGPYRNFNAIRQLSQLRSHWERANFTPAAQRESAKRLLNVWQAGDPDWYISRAIIYLRAVEKVSSHGHSVDVDDLPK